MLLTLKAARSQAGLSQAEVAKEIGVSSMSYSNYESKGTLMRVDKALMFSKVTQIPFDQIDFLKTNYTSSVNKEK